jgi:hypothetical protein
MLIKIFLTLLLLLPVYTNAANFSVTPLIIDVKAEVREAFVRDITVTSHHGTHQRLFASVHEITVGENSEILTFVPASMADRSTSVTSWIEITRSRVDLMPEDVFTTPLTIRVNHDTPAGLYHAFIGFAQGHNRDESEAKILSGQGTGVILRIEVGGKQEEFLKLTSFTSDRFSIKENDGELSYTLENFGDVPIVPKGDIIIYDGRGRELSSIQINDEVSPVTIEPGLKHEFVHQIPYINRLGRHKAHLSVEYGQESRLVIFDTIFYFSVPWYYLVLLMVLLLVALLGLVMMFKRGFDNERTEEVEAHDLPVTVGRVREHNQYDHDINLKNPKNNTQD